MKRLFLLATLVVSLPSLAQSNSKATPKAEVTIIPISTNTKITGKGSLVEHKKGTVSLRIEVRGLPPMTTHAIHIHAVGNCDSSGKLVGGHWNPTQENHGNLHLQHTSGTSAHRGDIGNLVANEAGVATLSMTTNQWCIGCADEKRNVLSKSLIIHEGKDDFVTQPTGGAGAKIGCGVIVPATIVGEDK